MNRILLLIDLDFHENRGIFWATTQIFDWYFKNTNEEYYPPISIYWMPHVICRTNLHSLDVA